MESGTFPSHGNSERCVLFYKNVADSIKFLIIELLEKHHPDEKITISEAAFRWIYNHSLLEGELRSQSYFSHNQPIFKIVEHEKLANAIFVLPPQ